MESYSALKRKEILTHAATWMNLEGIMLSETNRSQKANTLLFHSYEMSRVVKFIETERKMVVDRGWGRGNWGIVV